jgi:hypothetical protein
MPPTPRLPRRAYGALEGGPIVIHGVLPRPGPGMSWRPCEHLRLVRLNGFPEVPSLQQLVVRGEAGNASRFVLDGGVWRVVLLDAAGRLVDTAAGYEFGDFRTGTRIPIEQTFTGEGYAGVAAVAAFWSADPARS